MTPAPGWRKCTAYRQSGAGGMPLALPLSEGLGLTARSLNQLVLNCVHLSLHRNLHVVAQVRFD